MNKFSTGINIMFYDAVSIIHDIITTPNPFPYTAAVPITEHLTRVLNCSLLQPLLLTFLSPMATSM